MPTNFKVQSMEIKERCKELGKQICDNVIKNRIQHNPHVCRYCEHYMLPIILKDHLWTKGEMYICFDCIEKHVLKRKIKLSDLKEVPDNLPYFYGSKMK